jgi:RimJ/RimL family protein N-acetyltransferase
MIRRLVSLLLKLVYDKADFVFYTTSHPDPSGQEFASQLHSYPDFNTGRAKFHEILKNWWMQPLYYRFKSRKATLVTWEENDKILAYGWVQNWDPFRRKFGKIFPEAIMLGPYYTNPDQRGKGIYKKLLAYSLSCYPKDKAIAIYTSPTNISSQKGIEGSGFTKLGTFRVRLFFRWFADVEKVNGG